MKHEANRAAATSDLLVEAAALEFNEHGYEATDTNKIARRAGFAPQTFYRWFADKDAIFLEVYARWRESEWAAIDHALASGSGARPVAEVIVAHHVAYRRFRRSLRRLAVELPALREARTAARREQVARLMALPGRGVRDPARLFAALLTIERLSDAVAEGEFDDQGIDQDAAVDLIAVTIDTLFADAPAAD